MQFPTESTIQWVLFMGLNFRGSRFFNHENLTHKHLQLVIVVVTPKHVYDICTRIVRTPCERLNSKAQYGIISLLQETKLYTSNCTVNRSSTSEKQRASGGIFFGK